ncbi:cleavage stimulation factor subunit 2 [Pyrus ussuriensis x Pyrus communis]|uniref:Cleavage stimulation factor subunit 2 n=1 Tax=Pyrus ussuriensis x Pyrus communis TaxID=2448454 RepID=A0A5N5EWS9_9ROSA|nr:cleavage stimulation factor subunit 2 [Pyrus ussuriensis x Pyrus communis]
MAESDPTEASIGALLLVVAIPETINSNFPVLGSKLVAVEQTPPQLLGRMVKVRAQGRRRKVVKEKGDGEGAKEKKTDGSAARKDETRSPLEIDGSC